jgi:hypothetical protein
VSVGAARVERELRARRDERAVVAGTPGFNCDETYRLQGRFTDATHFEGTFFISFAGPVCGLVPDCRNQMLPVRGTRRP